MLRNWNKNRQNKQQEDLQPGYIYVLQRTAWSKQAFGPNISYSANQDKEHLSEKDFASTDP